MKLIAVKRISAQWPKGHVFETTDRRGRVLIAIKAAKRVDDVTPPAPVTAPPAPPPTIAPVTAPPAPPPTIAPNHQPAREVTSARAPSRRGRSFPIGPETE
jgi:hypothetical protein